MRIHSQHHLPRRAATGSRSRRRTGHGRTGHARSVPPFRCDDVSRCRYRAASDGQNREDATTIGRPLSGHTPPARHRQRTISGQRPTPCDRDTSVREIMSQTTDPGQHPSILPLPIPLPLRNRRTCSIPFTQHPKPDPGRAQQDTKASSAIRGSDLGADLAVYLTDGLELVVQPGLALALDQSHHRRPQPTRPAGGPQPTDGSPVPSTAPQHPEQWNPAPPEAALGPRSCPASAHDGVGRKKIDYDQFSDPLNSDDSPGAASRSPLVVPHHGRLRAGYGG